MMHRPAQFGSLLVSILSVGTMGHAHASAGTQTHAGAQTQLQSQLQSQVQGDSSDARRTIILRDLTSLSARVESISDEAIVVLDDRGLRRTIASAEVLALYDAQPRWRTEPSAAMMLALVDGQRVRGGLGEAMAERSASDGSGAESVRLMHPILGPVAAPLDRVWSLTRPGVPPPEAPASGEDVVVLTNNDMLLGFAVEVGVTTTLELADGRRQSIDAAAIGSMRIANELVPSAGPMLWLADGSAIRTRSVRSPESGAIFIEPVLASPFESESGDDLLAPLIPPVGIGQVVAWTPDASRFVALGTLAASRVEPVPPRVWADAPTLGDPFRAALSAPDVAFAGPCRVEWPLPEGADGFTSVVVLPESAHDWGDCEVVIHTVDGTGVRTERWRARVNAEKPRHAIALELEGNPRAISVTVEPGAYGGVQDTPILTAPLIRVARAPG